MGVLKKLFKNDNNEEQVKENIEEVTEETVVEEQEPVASKEYIGLLRQYALRYLGGNVNEVETQKRMVELLSKLVKEINIESLSFQVQDVFEKNNFGSFTAQQFQGQLGFEINRWIGEVDTSAIIEALPNEDINVIIGAWVTLDFFGFILKPEYKGNVTVLRDELIKEIKNRGIEFKQEQISQLEALQRQCIVISKNEPESEQIPELKKQIGELLLEQDAIWVAYDEDFLDKYMYIGLMGRLEIFTKEEYGQKARAHFNEVDEGHFKLRKIEKENIKAFFEEALYYGIVVFNLDNGTMTLELKIEDFMPFENEYSIDRANRNIRFMLLRQIQGLQRIGKIKDLQQKGELNKLYTKILNDNMTATMNTVVNSMFYVLADQPYVEDTTCFSKSAFDKIEMVLKSKNIDDKEIMISPMDKTHKIVETNTGLGRVVYNDKGTLLVAFTDKKCAEIMRKDMVKKGGSNFNVVCMTFIEMLPHALQGDGVVIDMPEYGFLLNKSLIQDVDNQIKQQNQNKENK